MKISVIDENTIRFKMVASDLKRLSLTYDQLDYSNAATRKVIAHLLEVARLQVGFQLNSGQMLIEVFPDVNNGCIIYISTEEKTLAREKQLSEPMVLQFDDCNSLCSAADYLVKRLPKAFSKSALYHVGSGYHLVLTASPGAPNDLTDIVGECCTALATGTLATAYSREHGKLLASANALQLLTL